MDLPYAFVDSIAKMVPQELNITLDKALQMNPEFRNLYETNEQVKNSSICQNVWRDFRAILPCMQQVL